MAALLTPDQFAQTIKTKYPQYQNVDNSTLVNTILKKYPQYKSQVDMGAVNKSSGINLTAQPLKNIASGILGDLKKRSKDAVNIAQDNANLIDQGLGEGSLKGFGNVLKGVFGAGFQQAGNVAGAVGDMFGEVFTQIVKNNPSVGTFLKNETQKFLGLTNALGQTNGETLKKLQQLSQKHPEAAKDFISGLNIAALLGGGESEGVSSTVEKTGDEVADTATSEVPKPPDTGTPPPEGGTKVPEFSMTTPEEYTTTQKGASMVQSQILKDGKPVGRIFVHQSPDGYEVTGINVDQSARGGAGAQIYDQLNQESITNTGKPLRSSPYLSDQGKGVWDSLVKNGKAIKTSDGYEMNVPDKTSGSSAVPPESDTGAKAGTRAKLTPLPEDVKTSAKSLFDSFKGDVKKAKSFVSDLFSQAKSKVGNVAEDTASEALANKQLPEAKEIIRQNLLNAAKAKNEALSKFGNAVTNEASSIVENMEERITKQFGSYGEKLDNPKLADTVRTLSQQMRDTLYTNTAKAWDKFVDAWQDKIYGSSALRGTELESFIKEYITGGESDINKMVKDTMDEAEGAEPGQGSYSQANDTYHSNAQARTDLKDNMGTLYSKTGKWSNAANFYRKAASGDSQSLEALRNIEAVSGVPIAQTANLAKFAELSSKSVSLGKIITDAIPAIFGVFGGKRTLYYDLVNYFGDPEGAIVNQLDKVSNGQFSPTIDAATQEVENSPEMMNQLRLSGLNAKQGAVMLILGTLNSSNKK